jgi:hypothetical protein
MLQELTSVVHTIAGSWILHSLHERCSTEKMGRWITLHPSSYIRNFGTSFRQLGHRNAEEPVSKVVRWSHELQTGGSKRWQANCPMTEATKRGPPSSSPESADSTPATIPAPQTTLPRSHPSGCLDMPLHITSRFANLKLWYIGLGFI